MGSDAWRNADVVWHIAAALTIDHARKENIQCMHNMSLVCKGVAKVLRGIFFMHNVYMPWTICLRVPYMDTHCILKAVAAHQQYDDLLISAFSTLIYQFRYNEYNNSASDIVQVVSSAMTFCKNKPCVLHLACEVLAWYCVASQTRYAQVTASGALELAVDAEHRYCAVEAVYIGFQTLLKTVQWDEDAHKRVTAARMGKSAPKYAGYKA